MSFSGTALKNLFSKPATTEYPAVPKEYPERTRGHVEVNIEECLLCGLCMRNCPPRAITVDKKSLTWSIERFDCIQCGYCVERCPKKCLKIVPGYTKPEAAKHSEEFTKPITEKMQAEAARKKIPKANLQECVFCTLCAKKCPAEALNVNREEKSWILNEETCIGCGLCASNCPKKCIIIEEEGIMHEYHKAVAWVEQANQEAAQKRASKVMALNVTFGESSGYSPEVVKNYFDEAAKGTLCEGAKFHVTTTRSTLKCPNCKEEFEKKLLDYRCPKCGAEGNPTESGNEVTLDSIECE